MGIDAELRAFMREQREHREQVNNALKEIKKSGINGITEEKLNEIMNLYSTPISKHDVDIAGQVKIPVVDEKLKEKAKELEEKGKVTPEVKKVIEEIKSNPPPSNPEEKIEGSINNPYYIEDWEHYKTVKGEDMAKQIIDVLSKEGKEARIMGVVENYYHISIRKK